MIKEYLRLFQFRTRVCPLRVRRSVHWATAGRHIDFMLCSAHISSIIAHIALTTLSMDFNISLGCCSFSTVRPLWSSGKTLATNAGCRGFEPHRGHKNLFFTIYSIRVKCEELFYRINIKLLKFCQFWQHSIKVTKFMNII